MGRYLSEAEHRWNHREEDLFTLVVLRLLIASAMQYKELIAPIPDEPATEPETTLDEEPI